MQNSILTRLNGFIMTAPGENIFFSSKQNRVPPLLACENSLFSSLLAAEYVSRSSSRNVLSGEERGETAVCAGYSASHIHIIP